MKSRTWFRVRFETTLGLIALTGALAGCASMAPGSSAESDVTVAPPLRRALLADPRAEAYQRFVVAELKARAGQYQDAIAELREAIKFDPATAALWIQLSQWLARTNDVPQAQEAAQKAIALEPDNADAHQAMAELLKRQKRFPETVQELEKAIGLAPQSQ